MIIYQKTCHDFCLDAFSEGARNIANIVADSMRVKGIGFSESSFESWKNSLPQMARVLMKASLPSDVDVSIEYKINQDRHRIDILIYGKDASDHKNVVIVELKQWSEVQPCSKPNFVHTYGGGGDSDYWHPSYQARNYAGIIENFNAYVQDNHVGMYSCSYLHNMREEYRPILDDEHLFPLVVTSPAFLESDEDKLASFIKKYVSKSCKEVLYEIDRSEIRPSPKLGDMLFRVLEGKEMFSLTDEQAIAVASIVEEARDSDEYGGRRTIVIKGKPGTGKSIVAINALGQLVKGNKEHRPINAAYFTQNAAPRLFYKKCLVSGDYRKAAIDALFKSPVCLAHASENEFGCILVDEAHRMYDWKGGIGVQKGVNLLEKAILAGKVVVFFIDEDQAVTTHDYVTIDRIKECAKRCHSKFIEGPTLFSEFRVLGGTDYIDFTRALLGYPNAGKMISYHPEQYDFKVFDSATELAQAIFQKNLEYKHCRLVAGYCYEWKSKSDYQNGPADIVLDQGNFKAKWNMNKNDYSWLYDDNSIADVGCIHTCQGLDMEYCGVIIGRDFRYENGEVVFDPSFNAKTDNSSGIRKCSDPELAKKLIRNTYEVLLTRGMRGTYVYCEDKGLRDHIKEIIK